MGYEDKCETQYMVKYVGGVPRRSSEEKCQRIPREVCDSGPLCKQEPRRQCKTVPSCRIVPREECSTLPTEKCQSVPVKC